MQTRFTRFARNDSTRILTVISALLSVFFVTPCVITVILSLPTFIPSILSDNLSAFPVILSGSEGSVGGQPVGKKLPIAFFGHIAGAFDTELLLCQ